MTEEQIQPVAPQADKDDAEKNKGMAILAYIIFFIPLLAAKDSKFAMYHANQGLVLFLAAIVGNIVLTIIPIIGWIIMGTIFPLVILIFAIMGIINASKGEMKPLPLIGGFNIIK
jgi:uncharacterized membrane protein